MITKHKKENIEKDNIDIQKGDLFVNDRGSIFIVETIDKEGRVVLNDYEDNSRYSNITVERIKSEYVKLDKQKYKGDCRQIKDQLEKEVIDGLKNSDLRQPVDDFNDTQSPCMDLVLTSDLNKDMLLSMKSKVELHSNKIKLVKYVLNGMLAEFNNNLYALKKQMGKINDAIQIVELYLGIQETIVTIREGVPASEDTPINFRQRILYMDEELGDPEDQGLDFREVEKFDEWLSLPYTTLPNGKKKHNFEKLIPEQKGVVALRVRRNDKIYFYDNLLANMETNERNHFVYILIRNGDSLYRIWTPHLMVDDKLFPGRNEFQRIMEEGFNHSWDKEKFEDKKYSFNKIALFMQGLLDRTQIFYPCKRINLFKHEESKGVVNFVYDCDETSLPTGKKYWEEWKAEINKGIKRGSRIYFCGISYWDDREYISKRCLPYQYRNIFNNLPKAGIYKVQNIVEEQITFIFNPMDEPFRHNNYHDNSPRKRGIGFTCPINEKFILNYDQISFEDIDFYLGSYVDRQKYIEMFPILWKIKKERLQEIEWEKHFVTFVSDREKVEEKIVWEAIDWWKYKNIWKRPIGENDGKALRMIEGRIKKLKTKTV